MENRGSQVSTHSQNSQKQTQKPKQNSQSKPKFNTGHTSGKGESRNEKRARWAKKSRPVAKPIVKRGPAKEYISLCCNLPAQKPVAGEKVSMKDAESGKMKTLPKGLGKWRCSGCHKISKVSVHKSEPKIVVVDMAKIEQRTVEGLSLGRGSEVPIA